MKEINDFMKELIPKVQDFLLVNFNGQDNMKVSKFVFDVVDMMTNIKENDNIDKNNGIQSTVVKSFDISFQSYIEKSEGGINISSNDFLELEKALKTTEDTMKKIFEKFDKMSKLSEEMWKSIDKYSNIQNLFDLNKYN